jgi:hypothetical protein
MTDTPLHPPAPRRRRSAAWLALVGLALILVGFALASGVGGIFAGQDPAGKAMMGGLLFAFFGGIGLIVLLVAVILAVFRRAR